MNFRSRPTTPRTQSRAFHTSLYGAAIDAGACEDDTTSPTFLHRRSSSFDPRVQWGAFTLGHARKDTIAHFEGATMLVAAPPPCTPRDLAAARAREGVRASTLLPSVHREKDTRSHFEGSTLVLSEAADSRKDPEALAAEEVDEWRAMLRESRAAPFAGVPMYAEYDGRSATCLEPAEVRLRSFTSSPSRTPSRGASRNATPSPNTMSWRA